MSGVYFYVFCISMQLYVFFFFFFNDTATTEIYTLSLHDALPIYQGVKAGDYFRIFRYQGSTAETVPQEKDYQFTMYGFGSAPQRYGWNDLPREILGEGIVFNASRNSSTMMITFSSSEVYAGDYIEIE